jgi:DNA-binding HxlR family transcriptional regulator
MDQTSTHFLVPATLVERDSCLGPDGSVAHISRMMRMIQGRWKLPILFRLYANESMRTLQLKRDLAGISQKMLTQHLVELANDGLIERFDFGEKPLRVEYCLSAMGKQLLPVLIEMRRFSMNHSA